MAEVGKVIFQQKTLLKKKEEEVEWLETKVANLKEEMERILT